MTQFVIMREKQTANRSMSDLAMMRSLKLAARIIRLGSFVLPSELVVPVWLIDQPESLVPPLEAPSENTRLRKAAMYAGC